MAHSNTKKIIREWLNKTEESVKRLKQCIEELSDLAEQDYSEIDINLRNAVLSLNALELSLQRNNQNGET